MEGEKRERREGDENNQDVLCICTTPHEEFSDYVLQV